MIEDDSPMANLTNASLAAADSDLILGNSLQAVSDAADCAASSQAPHSGVKSQERPRVSVIVVTYGSSKEIPDCVESVLRQSVPLELFLVDNASPDNTAKLVSDYAARFENVHAILNTENVGLAAGNNAPVGRLRGDYILILNPDTLFRDNSLETLVEFLDRSPDVAVVGPRNVYENGEPHLSFGKSWGLLDILMWRVIPYRLPRLLHDRMVSYETQDVFFISGSCLLIRRGVFEKIGGYDPEYFLTIEDVCDLCIRARQAGGRIVYLAEAEVVHLTGRSGVQAPYVSVCYAHRGSVYHFLKHKGIVAAVAVSLLLLVAIAARVVIAGFLGIANAQYRNVARIYARVFWNILVHNPIWAKGWRFRGPTSSGAARSMKAVSE